MAARYGSYPEINELMKTFILGRHPSARTPVLIR